jgi:hypothetical protein
MNLNDGDRIASIAKVAKEEVEESRAPEPPAEQSPGSDM